MTATSLLASLQPTRRDPGGQRRRLWKVWSTLAGVGAGLLARTAIQTAWTARTGEQAWTEATGELPPGFGEVAPGRAW